MPTLGACPPASGARTTCFAPLRSPGRPCNLTWGPIGPCVLERRRDERRELVCPCALRRGRAGGDRETVWDGHRRDGD